MSVVKVGKFHAVHPPLQLITTLSMIAYTGALNATSSHDTCLEVLKDLREGFFMGPLGLSRADKAMGGPQPHGWGYCVTR